MNHVHENNYDSLAQDNGKDFQKFFKLNSISKEKYKKIKNESSQYVINENSADTSKQ